MSRRRLDGGRPEIGPPTPTEPLDLDAALIVPYRHVLPDYSLPAREPEPVVPSRQGKPRPGPRPLVSRSEVEAARAELVERGLPAGERKLAERLGVSRDAVRYALGKDRRR